MKARITTNWVSEHELRRQEALSQYQILDTAPEAVFDELTHLAVQICRTPIALISLVDARRQWFKARVGLTLTETPRELAFCAYTILQTEPLIVPDALNDERFATNPLVTAGPKIRFYAGIPLINEDGYALGTLCVIDYVPHQLSPHQVKALQGLALQAVSELNLRRNLSNALNQSTELKQELSEVSAVLDNTFEGIYRLDNLGRYTAVNRAYADMIGYEPEAMVGMEWQSTIHPEDRESVLAAYQRIQTHGKVEMEVRGICEDGSVLYQQLLMIPAYDQYQQPIGHYCFINDITAGKRLAMECQQVEAFLRQQTRRERLVAEIAQRIRQSLDLEEILNTAVTEVQQFIQADRVLIYRLWPDGTGSGVTEAVTAGWPAILGRTFPEEVFPQEYRQLYSQGRVRVISDVENANVSPCLVEFLQQFLVKAKLVVPIILQKQELWGLLVAHQCSEPRQWQQLEIELLSHLATQVGIAIQQAELYQQVQQLAITDSLTDLANRRRFDEFLDQIWQQMARSYECLSLILCDIDFFKNYNDAYGHLAGDLCLQKVAQAIQQSVKRSTDLVARYGGEEFGIILPNTSAEDAIQVANTIRRNIKALRISHRGSQAVQHITLSLGISSTIPMPCNSPALLIRAADEALYQAKALGRDQFIFSEPPAAEDHP